MYSIILANKPWSLYGHAFLNIEPSMNFKWLPKDRLPVSYASSLMYKSTSDCRAAYYMYWWTSRRLEVLICKYVLKWLQNCERGRITSHDLISNSISVSLIDKFFVWFSRLFTSLYTYLRSFFQKIFKNSERYISFWKPSNLLKGCNIAVLKGLDNF